MIYKVRLAKMAQSVFLASLIVYRQMLSVSQISDFDNIHLLFEIGT